MDYPSSSSSSSSSTRPGSSSSTAARPARSAVRPARASRSARSAATAFPVRSALVTQVVSQRASYAALRQILQDSLRHMRPFVSFRCVVCESDVLKSSVLSHLRLHTTDSGTPRESVVCFCGACFRLGVSARAQVLFLRHLYFCTAQKVKFANKLRTLVAQHLERFGDQSERTGDSIARLLDMVPTASAVVAACASSATGPPGLHPGASLISPTSGSPGPHKDVNSIGPTSGSPGPLTDASSIGPTSGSPVPRKDVNSIGPTSGSPGPLTDASSIGPTTGPAVRPFPSAAECLAAASRIHAQLSSSSTSSAVPPSPTSSRPGGAAASASTAADPRSSLSTLRSISGLYTRREFAANMKRLELALSRYVRQYRAPRARAVTCRACPASAAAVSVRSLFSHVRSHSSKREPNLYVCLGCGRPTYVPVPLLARFYVHVAECVLTGEATMTGAAAAAAAAASSSASSPAVPRLRDSEYADEVRSLCFLNAWSDPFESLQFVQSGGVGRAHDDQPLAAADGSDAPAGSTQHDRTARRLIDELFGDIASSTFGPSTGSQSFERFFAASAPTHRDDRPPSPRSVVDDHVPPPSQHDELLDAVRRLRLRLTETVTVSLDQATRFVDEQRRFDTYDDRLFDEENRPADERLLDEYEPADERRPFDEEHRDHPSSPVCDDDRTPPCRYCRYVDRETRASEARYLALVRLHRLDDTFFSNARFQLRNNPVPTWLVPGFDVDAYVDRFAARRTGIAEWMIDVAARLPGIDYTRRGVNLPASELRRLAAGPQFKHVYVFASYAKLIIAELLGSPDRCWVLPNTCLCFNTSLRIDTPGNVHRHMLVVFRDRASMLRYQRVTAVNVLDPARGARLRRDARKRKRSVSASSPERPPAESGLPATPPVCPAAPAAPAEARRRRRQRDILPAAGGRRRAPQIKTQNSVPVYTKCHFYNVIRYVSQLKANMACASESVLDAAFASTEDAISSAGHRHWLEITRDVGLAPPGCSFVDDDADGARPDDPSAVAEPSLSAPPPSAPSPSAPPPSAPPDCAAPQGACANRGDVREAATAVATEPPSSPLDEEQMVDSAHNGDSGCHFYIANPVCGHFRTLKYSLYRGGMSDWLADLSTADPFVFMHLTVCAFWVVNRFDRVAATAAAGPGVPRVRTDFFVRLADVLPLLTAATRGHTLGLRVPPGETVASVKQHLDRKGVLVDTANERTFDRYYRDFECLEVRLDERLTVDLRRVQQLFQHLISAVRRLVLYRNFQDQLIRHLSAVIRGALAAGPATT